MSPFQCYGCQKKSYQRPSNLSAHQNKCPDYLAIQRRSEAKWKAELEARLKPHTSLGKRSHGERRDSKANKRSKLNLKTCSISPLRKASDIQIKKVLGPGYDGQPGRDLQVKTTPYLPLRSMPLRFSHATAPSPPPTQLKRGRHIKKRDGRSSEGR